MSRNHMKASADCSVCHWNPGKGRYGDTGGNPRDIRCQNPRASKRHHLLHAPAKHKRVAALEPDDQSALARLLYQEALNLFLRPAVPAVPLPHIDPLAPL